MNLPLKVLNNIATQDINKLNNNKRKNLIKAYNRNTKLLKKLIETNKKLIKESKFMINKLKSNVIFNHMNLFNKDYELILLIEKQFIKLDENLEKYLRNEIDNNKLIFKVNEEYLKTNKIVTSSINEFDKNISTLMNLYIKTNNILIIIMGIIVLFLLFILYRIGKIDLSYIVKAFKQINKHNYKSKKLSNFKPKFKEEQAIQEMINDVLEEQNFLQKIKIVTSRGYLITEVLDNLFSMIENELSVDRVGVAFVNYKDKEIFAEYGIANYDEMFLKSGFSTSFDETSLYKIIEKPRTIITNDLEKLYNTKSKNSVLNLLLREGIKSNIVFPLIIDQSVFGFLFFSSVNKNQFTKKTKQIGENIASEIAGILDKTYLTKIIFSKITIAFANLVEKKDTETGEHLDRMVEYSRFIAKLLLNHPSDEYCITNKFVREIVNNAPVHDIGKVAIEDKILKKPGKLNSEQWEIMKTHTTVGADIFSDLKKSLAIFNQGFYSVAENITRYHHEKWNGKGYPKGLKENEIPLEARIVAIADVFDALTSKRVYKDAFSFDKAWNIIKKSSGEHFDPNIIKLLKNNKKEFKNPILR